MIWELLCSVMKRASHVWKLVKRAIFRKKTWKFEFVLDEKSKKMDEKSKMTRSNNKKNG